MPQVTKDLRAFFCLFCYFAFGKSIRKIKTMVQLQVAMRAVAKSRSQIKPKPNKGLFMNANLIFSMAGALRCSMPFLQGPRGAVASF